MHCQLHCDMKHANDHTTLTHGQNSASVITRVLENKQSPAYSFECLSVRMPITRPNYHAEFDTTHTVHLVGHGAFITRKTSFHLGEQTKLNISIRKVLYTTRLIYKNYHVQVSFNLNDTVKLH
jgi:hypothetical protein